MWDIAFVMRAGAGFGNLPPVDMVAAMRRNNDSVN